MHETIGKHALKSHVMKTILGSLTAVNKKLQSSYVSLVAY